jgi:hypothetical protein
MGEASLVVMDLRGFKPESARMCVEPQTLLNTVTDRLLLLLDRPTVARSSTC